MAWVEALRQFTQTEIARKALSTLVVVVLVVIAFKLIARSIRRTTWPTPEARKRWIVMTRNGAVLLLILALTFIWAKQLQTIAFSFVAVALALVIALKELILCVSGELYRSSARLFRIGSRIDLAGIRGDVIDTTLLTTTIMEVGPSQSSHQYTGRAVVVPNAMLLSSPVYNESFTRHYVLHTFTVPISADADWRQAERHLLQAAEEACGDYLEDARRHIEKIGQREGLDTPAVDPRVSIKLNDPERIEMIMRMPVPARRKGQVEQATIRRYLNLNRGDDAPDTPQASRTALHDVEGHGYW